MRPEEVTLNECEVPGSLRGQDEVNSGEKWQVTKLGGGENEGFEW